MTYRPNSFLQFNSINGNNSFQRKDEWVTLHLCNGNGTELCPKHFARNKNNFSHLLQNEIGFSFTLHASEIKNITSRHLSLHAEIVRRQQSLQTCRKQGNFSVAPSRYFQRKVTNSHGQPCKKWKEQLKLEGFQRKSK